MSITALMTLFGALVMLLCWALVGVRIRQSASAAGQQIRLLRGFFLFMGLFCVAIFLPQLTLNSNPDFFSEAMAWGYVIGHVFCYIAFTYVLRLTFSMIPRLANKQSLAITIGILANIIITAVTIFTMVYSTQPTYDAERSVTLFNVAPIVGALIGLFALVCVLPAAVLFIINGVRNQRARTRSFLLGGGLVFIMISGPMHDIATSWELYVTADILSIIGFIILTSGIVYRFDERIAPARNTRTARA